MQRSREGSRGRGKETSDVFVKVYVRFFALLVCRRRNDGGWDYRMN